MSQLLIMKGDKYAVRTSGGTIQCFEFIDNRKRAGGLAKLKKS